MKSRLAPMLAAAFSALLPGAAFAEGDSVHYASDPDQERYTLHVQPPLLGAPNAKPLTGMSPTAIGGVYAVDVLRYAGYDIAGQARGNEPSLAINPLNPYEIVLTSFSGSAWGSGGNSTLFYSPNGGLSWELLTVVPPPTGTSTNINCPCDQTMEWGRDGQLYATFLHLNTGGSVQTVYSAQSPTPNLAGSWVYRTNAGVAQKTNIAGLNFVDQPWLSAGPVSELQPQTNVCVAYDNFNASFTNSQTRGADSPPASPMNFVRDQPTNSDGQPFNDGMNPGHRIAVGPTGVIFNVYQRYVGDAGSGVKQLTYLVTASADGGQTWSIANSDHPSGAKIIAADVLSFQGNGSKVGGVNALLGGVTAISVDPASGTAWVVYGARATATSVDRLFLVSVTYNAGSLTVGSPALISPALLFDAYLPAVAVLPNGEVGVLYMTYRRSDSTFAWVLRRPGAAPVELTSFTSPFANNGLSNQRILGDYVQLKAAGCDFYGAFPARGDGVNSVNSIDPWFVKAPASQPCELPLVYGFVPSEACVGDAPFLLTVQGTGFLRGATVRVEQQDRTTFYGSSSELSTMLEASDLATAGRTILVLNPAPAGGTSQYTAFPIDAPSGSPGNSLRLMKESSVVLRLNWDLPALARRTNIKRCVATSAPCTPTTVASPSNTNFYQEVPLDEPGMVWYLIEADNACGPVP